MNVAEYVAEFLISKGVKQVFGYQGGAVLKLIDCMYATEKIDFIQNFNEQASAFAADAQGRIRNDIGVAIATSGPGATNLITGIANAYFDSVPTMFITGQDYLCNIRRCGTARQNGFQDLDIVSIVKKITKYAVMIDNPSMIKYELEKAYHLATSDRKGPVLIDIPIDIQFSEVNLHGSIGFLPEIKKENLHKPVKNICDILKLAKSPVILAGGGIRMAKACDEFLTFIDRTGIPVVTTLNGIDVYEKKEGFSGLYGNSCANLAILNADVILVFGSRLSQRQVGKDLEKYTNAKIIHVDLDNSELSRVFKSEIAINSDLKIFLGKLNNYLLKVVLPDYYDWKLKIKFWEKKYENNVNVNKYFVDPVLLTKKISKFLSNGNIVVSDVGQNQMWVAQGISVKYGVRCLNSCGLGAMGYSVPAALGASYLTNNFVISFSGDGGFQMNLQELNTISVLDRNIKCFVFNNNTLGMMREVQKRYYDEHYIGTTTNYFTCPDLKKLAEVFNLKYIKIEDNFQFYKLKDVFADTKPWLVDVKVQFDSKLLNRYDDEAMKDE